MSSDHTRGISIADAIAVEHGIDLVELRAFAAERLAEQYADMGITDADIGSSDVSIQLSELARAWPELLHEEAARVKERDEMVARVAASTGRTHKETLINLQRLLASTDDN